MIVTITKINGELRVLDPSQLSDVPLHLSRLQTMDAASASETPVVLALLQPLSEDEMFAACHEPIHEILNLDPLGRAWRQALRDVPPMTRMVFDLTLPMAKGDKDGELQTIY